MIADRSSGLFAAAAKYRKRRMGPAKGLKARLAGMRDQLGEAQPSPLWIEAAAVLAAFHPSQLRTPQGKAAATGAIFAELLETSEALAGGEGLRTLDLPTRRRILSALGNRTSMKAALAPNAPGPEVPAQKGFAVLLEGGEVVDQALAGDDAVLLTGIAEAMLWVEDILNDLPSREIVLRELARARVIEPLHTLIGEHFAGREEMLERMRRYIDEPASADNVLYLHGIGGSGKSTTLAKFALDVRSSGAAQLVVYLNFDRATLDVKEPLTVLREIVEQIAAQTQQKRLHALRENIDDYIRRFAHGREVLESLHDGGGNWWPMIDGVAQAIREIPGDGPFLVLIDTFERAQRFGETTVREFWMMLRALGEEAPRLRFIAAGRVDMFGVFRNALELGGLDRLAVEDILKGMCGRSLPSELVKQVIDITDGRPLGVRLVGLLLKRTGLDTLDDPRIRADALLEIEAEQAEAMLYNRLLGQIGSPVVQKLAPFALLLRRITPSLIDEVLAPLAGVDPDGSGGWTLFEQYEQEVDLIERDHAEWNEAMLTHRLDVRTVVLGDLRDALPETDAEIDLRAIAYFERRQGHMARAEEIYHRLWTDEPVERIAARWQDGCAPYLQDAVDEVPYNRRVWLANKIGIDLSADVRVHADLAEWETYAVRTAQMHLNRGDTAGALDILKQRDDRLPGSALFAIEADALSRMAMTREARDVIDRGLASAASASAKREATELWLVRSLIHERGRRFAASGRDAARAFDVASVFEFETLCLRAIAALLRLHRKSNQVTGPKPEKLVAKANEILDTIGDKALLDQPNLMRSLAGELGPTRPHLVMLAVESTGGDTISTPAPELSHIERRETEKLSDPELEQVADVIERLDSKKGYTLRHALSTLTAVAAERRVLKEITVSVAHVLAAEIDQLVGAFPSPSRLKSRRSPRWWRV